MVRGFIFSTLVALLAAPAWAGDIVVTVTTPDGAPLENAVVTIDAPRGSPSPNFPWKLEIAQTNKTFSPFVLIAPVGAEVAFPNLDKFRHHVYSFSKGNKFELELYGREEERSHRFKTAGVAALGCNIHDEMVAFVRIVDTPYAAKSDAAGRAAIMSAPNGEAKLTIWHPHAKGRAQTVEATAVISEGSDNAITVVVNVNAPQRH